MTLERFLEDKTSYALYDENKFLDRKSCCFDASVPIAVKVDNRKEEVMKKINDFFGESTITEGEGFVAVETKGLFEKTRFTYGDLLEIIRRLRDPDGCPWDRQQTPETIRTNIVEEAYELVEAIESGKNEKIEEESGDVMLQGIFCSIMTEENGGVSNNDVITALCKKLIGRHTHIFGSDKATDAKSALYFWEQAKAKEKGQKSVTDKLDVVPKTFTALQRASKVQKIIKKTGFDFPTAEEAADKIKEETAEFFAADGAEKEKEGGDMLFSVVNLLRMYNIDPEIALNGTTNRFENRFRYVVEEGEKKGKKPEEMTLEEMEELYQAAKKKEKR